MCPSSWKLYLDDFPFFLFLSSSSRTRARAVWSLGCLKLMPLAMMMICRTFISQTSNSSSSGSRQAREELKKRKIIYIQFPRWWAHKFMSSDGIDKYHLWQAVHKCTMHINTNCAQMHNAHRYLAQLVSNRASVGNCHLASSLPPCHSRSHTFHSESFTLFNLPRMLYSLYVPTVYFSQFYPLTLVTQGRIRFTLRVFTLFNLS